MATWRSYMDAPLNHPKRKLKNKKKKSTNLLKKPSWVSNLNELWVAVGELGTIYNSNGVNVFTGMSNTFYSVTYK